MFALLVSLYFLILLLYAVTGYFVVYHLIRYSINSELNKIVIPLFLIITPLLILSNMLLFFSIDWETIFSNLSI